ncbi:unnamed protein product [Spodoptera exigua]|nr:unnamed protein product [Spodoptera exigua]
MTAIKALFVGSLNNKELIRFRVNDMCTHIFFKPLVLAAFNLTDSCGVFKGKIVAVTNGKEFLRLQVKKPCEHLFLRPLFSSLMNVTKDCFVVKGHYKFHVDILGIAQSYFGGTFVFGNWTFKSLFYNEACNFSCANIQVILSPKKEH